MIALAAATFALHALATGQTGHALAFLALAIATLYHYHLRRDTP